MRANGLLTRGEGALFLAASLVFAVAASGAGTVARRQRAAAAYDKAQQMHATLEAHPESRRTKEEYRKVIDAYMGVYRAFPAYGKAPAALAAAAELYQEMGRQFSNDSYFLDSIKSYRFLMKQSPDSHISREALFTIAEVYRQDLEDPDDARKTYERFIEMYPKSDRVPEAKERLQQLHRQAQAGSHAAPPPPPEQISEKPKTVLAPPPVVEAVPEEHPSGLREVTAVRRWVGTNYLRIVIEVDGEAQFESARLSHPDRIVLDLHDARLSHELVGKTFPVENGYLRQVRVAQFSPQIARVVLDVEKIVSYSIFSLPNPYRLVIDVQGTAPTQIARTVKPAPPTRVGNERSDKVHSPAVTTPPASSVPVESAVKSAPPAPTMAKSENAPATVTSNNEKETAVLSPPPVRTPTKKTEEKSTAPTSTGVTPAILPAAPTESGSRTLTRALGLKIGRIVIDPGHGGHDTGTIGPTGLEEKTVVLDVGLKLKKLLEQNTGCEVVMTRSDDTFIPLEERTAIANQKGADLFISIHANASRDTSARGIETYYLNFTSNADALEVAARENASSQEAVHQLQDLIKKIALSEKIEESADFARQVQREVYTRVSKASGAQRDRGIKKAPFVVLIGANMPSILAEISFLTNPRDERLLRRSDYREKIAYALYQGILDYLKDLGEVRTAQRATRDQPSTDQTSVHQSPAATQPDF